MLTPTAFALDTAGGMCCENIYTYDQQEKETNENSSLAEDSSRLVNEQEKRRAGSREPLLL